jgi:hypothetical protein
MLEKLNPKKKRKASLPQRVVQWFTSLPGGGAKQGARKGKGKAKATSARATRTTGATAKSAGAKAKSPAKRAGSRTNARRKAGAAR